jgi:hypothetical protein
MLENPSVYYCPCVIAAKGQSRGRSCEGKNGIAFLAVRLGMRSAKIVKELRKREH